jgi:hypothetical protein
MFFKRFVTGLAVTALFAPQLSFAATSQQLLDRAVTLSVAQSQPLATTMDVNFTYNYRPVARGEHGGGLKVHVVATSEVLPRTSLLADSEQRFRVESVELIGAEVLGLFGTTNRWKDPMAFEMKKIGNVYYVRLASLSDDMRTLIAQAEIPGLNLDQIVGRWLQIDLDHVEQSLSDALPVGANIELTTEAQENFTRQFLPLVQKPGVLRVVRLESRTNRNGVMYSRVQFQVNPRFWTELEAVLRKQIEKDLAGLKTSSRSAYNTQYTAQMKELRTTLALVRAHVAKIRMIAVLNEQTGMIERVESAGTFTQPSYSEQYVGRRLAKRLVGYNTFGFNLVSSMKLVADRSLVAPTGFVTLDSLVQLAKQKFEAMSSPSVAE